MLLESERIGRESERIGSRVIGPAKGTLLFLLFSLLHCFLLFIYFSGYICFAKKRFPSSFSYSHEIRKWHSRYEKLRCILFKCTTKAKEMGGIKNIVVKRQSSRWKYISWELHFFLWKRRLAPLGKSVWKRKIQLQQKQDKPKKSLQGGLNWSAVFFEKRERQI